MHAETTVTVQPAAGTTQIDIRNSYVPYRELPEYKTPYVLRKTEALAGLGFCSLLYHAFADMAVHGDRLRALSNTSFIPLVHMARWGLLATAAVLFTKGALTQEPREELLTEEHCDSLHANKTASMVGLAATAGVLVYKFLVAIRSPAVSV